jgi:FRG1-like family.
MVKLRSNSLHLKNLDKDDDIPEEERTNKLSDIELNYVKKFQKFQDKKIKLNSDNIAVLKEAKAQGYLHETMLDRRSKMKADRYCK